MIAVMISRADAGSGNASGNAQFPDWLE